MTVTLRQPTDDDLEAVRRIGLETWPATYGFAGAAYVADGLARWWSVDALRESLRTSTYWLAEVEGEVVGVGNVDLRPDPPVIWKLYVLPDRHGSGVGGALLERLVGSVPADRGHVTLEYVDGNDRAAAFYAKHGFVEVRREPAERPGEPAQVWVERSVTGDG
jgi:ribosomal protein S18 acetylase RimI-like enzyme